VGSVLGPIRFLLPVCWLCWFLYTLNIYAHFSLHFSQQLLMAKIWLVTKYQIPVINSCLEKCDETCAYTNVHCMLIVYKYQQNRQTGSRNLMGPKTLPTIWATYMKLVIKYQISAINSYWEKCDEKFIVVSVFGPIRFLLPVCRFCWFLYTLNIHFVYAHF
jgi:hypothetical protein